MLEPDIPDEGICAGQDGRACRLCFDHHRKRTTGPRFPLTVVRCRPHECAFTLYPPGHVLYGRKALAPTAGDGSRIQGGAGAERFRATVFEPALDAAQGRAWHREHVGPTERWWGSQLRGLELAARLLGLAADGGERLREQMAELLRVDSLLLHEQSGRLRAGGYRERGDAIASVLAAVPGSRFLFERLAECGHLAGLWGQPYRWLPELGDLRRQPFRAARAGGARSPP